MDQILERFLTSERIFVNACILPRTINVISLTTSNASSVSCDAVELFEVFILETIILIMSIENMITVGTITAAMLIRLV